MSTRQQIIFIFLFSVSTLIAQNYSGGSGTTSDPYQIANKNDLKYLSEHSSDWTKSFIQTADINLSSSDFQSGGDFYNGGAGFIPIGNSSTKFTGNYNGNGHLIDGIFINRDGTHYIGLFGYIGNYYSPGNSSTIENLSVINIYIAGEDNTAGLVGYSTKSTVKNCYSSGSVSGHYQVGGLVGYNNDATISESFSTCTIDGIKYIGGVSGKSKNNTAEIAKSYSTGNVIGEQIIGGLVGSNEAGAIINNCYCTGDVTRINGTNGYIGAFSGYNNSTIEYSFSLSSVFESPGTVWDEGSGGKDKGFIGYNNSGIYNYNFWNKDISNQDATLNTSNGDSVATSITTVKMRYHSFFTDSNWDFIIETTNGTDDIWDMDQEKTVNNGFPILSWQTGADQILAYSGGDGSSVIPYQIGNLNDLSDLTQRNFDWDSYFIQIADIDAAPTHYWDDADDNSDGDLFNDPNDQDSTGNNEGFLPIANDSVRFTGSYNGNDHTISNLFFYRSGYYNGAGLFGCASGNGTVIEKVHLVNIRFYSTLSGGIVGFNYNSALVSKCSVTGSIHGNYIGGIASRNDSSSTISECNSNIHSYSSGLINGGIVGINKNSSTIFRCYSLSNVEGSDDCWYLGGLIALNDSSSLVAESYSRGNVTGGDNMVGGFVGDNANESQIINCYCTGDVDSPNSISETPSGGFCGVTNSIIEYCYCTGSGSYRPFIGAFAVSHTFTANFWDSETSNKSTGYGATPKTTAEMQNANTFIDSSWDFILETTNGTNDIWDIDQEKTVNNGYPILSWQTGADQVLFYNGGIGTSSNPYKIANKADLKYLEEHENDWSSYFIQIADITFASSDFQTGGDFYNSGNGFIPIGNFTTKFTGFYDGNNKNISGIFINRSSEDNVGFFGYTEGITIQDLGALNTDITGNNYVGGLIGNTITTTAINCNTSGILTASSYGGGLIGNNTTNSQISNSYSICTVSGNSWIGGLVGWNYDSTIDSCYSHGNVSGNNDEIGGLVGMNYNSSTVLNSYSDCTVSGEGAIGGLVGQNEASSVQTSYSTGTVSGTYSVGNFAGFNSSSSVISNSYCTGSVTRTSSTNTSFGAFCGENENSTIEYCYSSTSVYSSSGTAWNEGGNADKGFVGGSSATVTYTANFFDSEASNQLSATGAVVKTTSEMRDVQTFLNASWDFISETANGNNDYWDMDQLGSVNNGYPILIWQDGSDSELPVELTSFIATSQKKGVMLNWSTATEINNYGFEVERQILNQVQNNNNSWEAIGFVEGHGNSNSPNDYSFLDDSQIFEEVSYRLKQIDADGGFEYSDVVTVSSIKLAKNELYSNYPNPFNPTTQISYSLAKDSQVSIIVYDALGQKVTELVNKKQSTGIHNVEFDASNLSSGLYFYRLETPNYSKTMKMMLLK